MQAEFPNVMRYFVTLSNQPEFIAAIGETKLTTEELKYTRVFPTSTSGNPPCQQAEELLAFLKP